ncbi:TRAP transporter, DctM subunit [Tistlia consotensis]|uniref:TRAP transporter large permease protein n=1 Tax=Tistlia consotensis USBA 355 TaxID=560819 RepID=A0A1Y6CPQ6_9PROT|nr:TRAP transporter large permease [Tistlia consotensis]SMF69110.1 TRAP transporter, DctM subunit [Tistlia consotensis USBA 355]SNS01806.1 TRAP transporter, DctM subunit [Tistlia consotensis]
MAWDTALLLYGVILAACLVGGVAIGTTMGLIGIIGVTLVSGSQLWASFGDIVWNTTNTFTLVSIPLFVLMGEIILRSGLSQRFYSGVSHLLAPFPGGLAHTNIVGCAVFSALAGSSVATAMTVGTVALPEMRRRGYSDRLTLGSLTGGGCLGILIPPSIPIIVYASIVQESVVDLFVAGILPGLVLAACFMAYIALRTRLSPEMAPTAGRRATPAEVLRGLLDTVPVGALIAAILGGMYWGVVTPTEAAGFGCLLATLIGLAYRDLTWASLREALVNAVLTSTVVLFITINAQVLSFAITTSGIGRGVAGLLTESGLGPFAFFCLLFLLYLVVGMFIDGLSILLLTVPVLYPGLVAMGFDGVWTGIVLVVFIELGALTPPMGLNLFAIKSITPATPLGEIGWASLPFALIIAGFGFLLYAFPGIALYLPSLMRAH